MIITDHDRIAIAEAVDSAHLSAGVKHGDFVETLLAELAAAGFVIERDWGPIAEAPKENKKELLLLCVNENGGEWIEIGWFSSAEGEWVSSTRFEACVLGGGQHEAALTPTHFRPLPAPPHETLSQSHPKLSRGRVWCRR